MAILNISMIIIGTIIIYNVPTMCGHRGTLTDTRGTITVIIVVATNRSVRGGGVRSRQETRQNRDNAIGGRERRSRRSLMFDVQTSRLPRGGEAPPLSESRGRRVGGSPDPDSPGLSSITPMIQPRCAFNSAPGMRAMSMKKADPKGSPHSSAARKIKLTRRVSRDGRNELHPAPHRFVIRASGPCGKPCNERGVERARHTWGSAWPCGL